MEKEKAKYKFRVINLNESYQPRFDELLNPNRNIITCGENNDYPQYLINLLNRSAKHRAIVETKSSMIGGNEWNKQKLTPQAISFIKNKWGDYDLDEIVARNSFDLEVHGSFALNIIWSKDRQSISRIDYIDVSKLRVHYDSDMKVDGYVLCDDWTNVRKFRPVLYPKFSTTDRAAASQILYVKTYSPGCEFYSVPSYIGALNWIELEYEVSNFHLSSVQNGFTPGMLINFSAGVPTDEEIEEMVRDMKAQYAGARNGQNPMITFSEGKDGAPTFTPIELNASDKRFIELNRNITEGIMAGHRVVNPNLFGIKESGEGIGSSDIIDYLNIFNAEYVIPKQKLIEKVYNRLIRVNNNEDKLVLNKFILKLDVKTSTTDILSILTSTISDDQKRQTLQLIGITQEESIKLVPIENKLTP